VLGTAKKTTRGAVRSAAHSAVTRFLSTWQSVYSELQRAWRR